MVYVCEEHETSFESEAQARAHWNFTHGKGAWTDILKEEIQQESTPEGFTFKSAPQKTERAEPAPRPDKPPVRPAALKVTIRDDAEAERLEHMLTAIGVPEGEVNRIITGFTSIPRIRSDANFLSHWLDTHIRADKALKEYIPMIIQEVLGDTARPAPIYGTPTDRPQYGYSPYYREEPYGYRGNFREQPPYYPPPPQNDPEAAKHIGALEARIDSVLETIQAERVERERERREREQREREQQVNARIDKLQEVIVEFIKGKGASDKSETDKATGVQVAALVSEIKTLREDQQKQLLENMLSQVNDLRAEIRQATAARGETIGRSTEDLVHDLGPLALDKIDKAGERIQGELRGLREQIGPAVKENLDKAAQGGAPKTPKSVAEIEDQIKTENAVLDIAGDIKEVDEAVNVTVEDNPADSAYARMPRRRRKEVDNDEVSRTPAATDAP